MCGFLFTTLAMSFKQSLPPYKGEPAFAGAVVAYFSTTMVVAMAILQCFRVWYCFGLFRHRSCEVLVAGRWSWWLTWHHLFSPAFFVSSNSFGAFAHDLYIFPIGFASEWGYSYTRLNLCLILMVFGVTRVLGSSLHLVYSSQDHSPKWICVAYALCGSMFLSLCNRYYTVWE